MGLHQALQDPLSLLVLKSQNVPDLQGTVWEREVTKCCATKMAKLLSGDELTDIQELHCMTFCGSFPVISVSLS